MSRLISQPANQGFQPLLGLEIPVPEGIYDYGVRSDGGAHGLVLTKLPIVELILDLAGYRIDQPLTKMTLLEPACGHGAFLGPAVDRLIARASHDGIGMERLGGAILAFDIDPGHVEATRKVVVERLLVGGIDLGIARDLAASWIRQGDFLLAELDSGFDVVVGNPPYVRIEQVSSALQAEYRGRFRTLFDRADLYVAFIERSLRLLGPKGNLAFICADRWTLNRYGAPLRALIAEAFHVKVYLDLHHAMPFESDVIAYPSVFLISRELRGGATLVGALREIPHGEAGNLEAMAGLVRYENWFSGGEPWVLTTPAQLATLRAMEARFPALEDDGLATVRIGVATGRDDVFIVPDSADIEPDRMVPLVMREDLDCGTIREGGRFVLDTSNPQGGLVDLGAYPRLKRHLDGHAISLRKRHVAKARPAHWYRTIDRVYPEMVIKPKLLIPDIAGSNQVVFDDGNYYPHHNLYFVLSDHWDLEVLGGLLSSRVALFFVWSYAVKMRGGYLRFQAQYLRKIRVPRPESLSGSLSKSIKEAFRARDFHKLDELALEAYGLEQLPEFDFTDLRK